MIFDPIFTRKWVGQLIFSHICANIYDRKTDAAIRGRKELIK